MTKTKDRNDVVTPPYPPYLFLWLGFSVKDWLIANTEAEREAKPIPVSAAALHSMQSYYCPVAA